MIKLSDSQKDVIENLYLAGADKSFIVPKEGGKALDNKIATLVQKGLLHVDVSADVKITYKLTEEGIKEAHRAFNITRV